jgi:hypothetical protein
MGRKSKLTESQWADVERRMLEGEPVRALAREFGVSEAAIRARKGSQVDAIKSAANQLVAAEQAVRSLPISAQISARNFAHKLQSLSDNLLGAAMHGAATAHRLNALANSEVQKVDDAQPLKSIEALRGVSSLTKLANDSAAIGLNLLAANRKVVDRMNDGDADEDAPAGLAEVDPIEASRRYQAFISG